MSRALRSPVLRALAGALAVLLTATAAVLALSSSLSPAALDFYYFAAYDSSGNLYVSGMTKANAYSLSALLHGAKTMVPVSVAGGTLHFPGSVFFNGQTLVVDGGWTAH